MQKFIIGVVAGLLSSCIGVDIVDDEPVDPILSISPMQGALNIGDNLQFNASYTNEFGQPTQVPVTWTSSQQTVLGIDGEGLATALSAGQTMVTASNGSTISNVVLITVVADSNAVASVNILSDPLNLQLNDTLTLEVEVLNLSGEMISGAVVSWSSNNPQVVTVDTSGKLQALTEGTAEITASVDGINSTPLVVTVGDNQRTGTFMGANGYTTEGTATLTIDGQDQLILTLSDDFDTDFALGTFLYLSNSTGGASTRNNGLELAELTTDGAATFNITEIMSSVGIHDYQYVVVLCKPASITFGFADLSE